MVTVTTAPGEQRAEGTGTTSLRTQDREDDLIAIMIGRVMTRAQEAKDERNSGATLLRSVDD